MTRFGVPEEQREALAGKHDLLKLYLNQMCDWLAVKGWLDRAYMQLWDEPGRDTWGWGCRRACDRCAWSASTRNSRACSTFGCRT